MSIFSKVMRVTLFKDGKFCLEKTVREKTIDEYKAGELSSMIMIVILCIALYVS